MTNPPARTLAVPATSARTIRPGQLLPYEALPTQARMVALTKSPRARCSDESQELVPTATSAPANVATAAGQASHRSSPTLIVKGRGGSSSRAGGSIATFLQRGILTASSSARGGTTRIGRTPLSSRWFAAVRLLPRLPSVGLSCTPKGTRKDRPACSTCPGCRDSAHSILSAPSSAAISDDGSVERRYAATRLCQPGEHGEVGGGCQNLQIRRIGEACVLLEGVTKRQCYGMLKRKPSSFPALERRRLSGRCDE